MSGSLGVEPNPTVKKKCLSVWPGVIVSVLVSNGSMHNVNNCEAVVCYAEKQFIIECSVDYTEKMSLPWLHLQLEYICFKFTVLSQKLTILHACIHSLLK